MIWTHQCAGDMVAELSLRHPTRAVHDHGPGCLIHGLGIEAHAEPHCTMRAELIGHFKPCMTEIYLHIVARMADYIHTHP